MANRRRERARTTRTRGREKPNIEVLPLPYDRRNLVVFLSGLAVIAVGYLCLGQPPVDGFLSLTLAPMLLVIGYLGLIPAALLLKKKDETQKTEDKGQTTDVRQQTSVEQGG